MTYTWPEMAACSLMAYPEQGDGCWRCAKPLPKRRSRWCSDECAQWWHRNHWMNRGRFAVLERSEVWALPFVEVVAGVPDWDGDWGTRLQGPFLIERGKHRIGYACEGCDLVAHTVEADHITAANGSHSKASCIHHLDNLRALCVPCHRARTKQQAKERAGDRRQKAIHARGQMELAG